MQTSCFDVFYGSFDTVFSMLLLLTLSAGFIPPQRTPAPASTIRHRHRHRHHPPVHMALDVNNAMTRLNAAVAAEDYGLAAQIKAEIDAERAQGSEEQAVPALSWTGTVPTWLCSRLEGLGFRYPTPVQAGALAATEDESQRHDLVISAPTGAGKTLAFAVPLLRAVAADLEDRGDATVAAVTELLDSPLASLSPTDAMDALSPQLRLPKSAGSGGALGGGDGADGGDGATLPVRGPPLALVVAPTAALVEQSARLLFSLVGGYARESRSYTPGAQDSLFRYEGPKAVRIVALATAADASAAAAAGALTDCDVVCATPAALAALQRAAGGWAEAVCVACVDEADACAVAGAETGDIGASSGEAAGLGEALEPLPARASRLLVGATMGATAVAGAIGAGWLAPPMLVDGRGSVAAWSNSMELSSLALTALCPPGLTHRFAVVEGGEGGEGGGGEGGEDAAVLLALARLLRRDIRLWEEEQQRQQQQASSRPRAVVFTADAPSAQRAGRALRAALWGEQAVVVRAGEAPEVGAAAFRSARANRGATGFENVVAAGGASVMVTPMADGRGLDFPDVSHVYCVGLLEGLQRSVGGDDDDGAAAAAAAAAEYAHLAGRAGRVGQAARGVVTSVLAAESDTAALAAIVRGALGVPLEEVGVPAADEGGGDDGRRALEDLLAITETDEESA